MEKRLLPIGSVVLLKGGNKEIMIYGRRQKSIKDGTMWDYIACPYPEGNISEKYMYLFNHSQIDRIFFIGYQTAEEFDLQKFLASDYDKD